MSAVFGAHGTTSSFIQPRIGISKAEYFAKLDAWAKEGKGSDENRIRAVELIKTWVEDNRPDDTLNLSGLHLSNLPPLPHNLPSLTVSIDQPSLLAWIAATSPAHLVVHLSCCVGDLKAMGLATDDNSPRFEDNGSHFKLFKRAAETSTAPAPKTPGTTRGSNLPAAQPGTDPRSASPMRAPETSAAPETQQTTSGLPLPASQPGTEKSSTKYFAEWDAWAQAGDLHEQRNKAVQLMKTWVENDRPDADLDLSGLKLKELPEHPPAGVRTFRAMNNMLTKLPDWSGESSIKSYSVARNLLTSVKGVPGNVETLIIESNLLRNLDGVPHNVTHLYADMNQLEGELPPMPSVQHLSIANNNVKKLPEMPALLGLTASNNKLTDLPSMPLVKMLSVNKNQLQELSLPPTVTFVSATDNPWKRRPEQPAGVKHFNVRN